MNEITLSDLEKTHKLCSTCKCYKLLSGFSKHPGTSSGLQSYCKDCYLEYSRKKYREKIHDPLFLDKIRNQKRSTRSPEKSIEFSQKYRSLYPEKHNARARVAHAIKAGKIIRQPCEVCGFLIAEAHHDDYTKPLDVRWLCKKHHAEHHRKYK